MPRDSNGNYTLPAGNPVVTDTVISSTVFNNTMNDIKDAITDSLSRTGDGGMQVALSFGDGTEALPGGSFNDEPSTGFYRIGAGQLGISVLGNLVTKLAADYVDHDIPIRVWDGATYQLVLTEGDDATITGTWTFDELVTLGAGALREGKGRVFYHESASYASSAIHVSASPPGASDGSDGDIWLELE